MTCQTLNEDMDMREEVDECAVVRHNIPHILRFKYHTDVRQGRNLVKDLPREEHQYR